LANELTQLRERAALIEEVSKQKRIEDHTTRRGNAEANIDNIVLPKTVAKIFPIDERDTFIARTIETKTDSSSRFSSGRLNSRDG
jgi:hypothetical protein